MYGSIVSGVSDGEEGADVMFASFFCAFKNKMRILVANAHLEKCNQI